MDILILAVTGFVAWLVSTVAGGGGALLMIPIISFLAGARAVAPVVTLGTLMGGASRIYLFWHDVNWKIVRWYLPGAVAGAFIGAYLFAAVSAEWLQVILGLILISAVFQFQFGERERTFTMRTWYFLPVGFGVAFLSGLAGATGEILTPFYLNYGALKEEMISTKSVNSFVMHLTKVGTYAAFGALTWQYVLYGVAIGLAAILASWLGKRLLAQMKSVLFRRLALAIMAVSGAALLWQQRELIAEWLA